jgi:hypothetical protein
MISLTKKNAPQNALQIAGRSFGEEIFEGDIVFFAREILPAILRERMLGTRNSHNEC